LSYFNEFSREIFEKFNKKNLSSGSGVVPRGLKNGQTDRYEEAN